jgi:hypothetical protein
MFIFILRCFDFDISPRNISCVDAAYSTAHIDNWPLKLSRDQPLLACKE